MYHAHGTAFGPAVVTSDPNECIDYLNSISAHRGGDCPELCLSGIELALTNCLPNSDVYVFTDADPKDEEKESNVVTLTKETNSRVQFILTGSCSRRRRRDIRKVRSTTLSSYEIIAEESGGAVYQGSKSDIEQLVNLLDTNVGAALVYVAKSYITRFHTLLFAIDETISTLTISISSGSSNDVIVYTPSGTKLDLADPNVTVTVNTSSVFSVTVRSPERGEWSCNCSDSNSCDVEVTSQSTVDFQYRLITVDETTGLANDIDGSPVAGTELAVNLKVFGVTYVSSVDYIELVSPAGVVVKCIVLSKVESRTDDTYSATFIVPSEVFSVSLQASDKHGNSIQRLKPTKIKPETFQLVQISSDADELIPGSSIVTKFRLINSGPQKMFTLSDSINGGGNTISSGIRPPSVLASASNVENITHTLYASSAAQVGTSITVTVRAEESSTGSFNYVVFWTSVNNASTLVVDNEHPTLTHVWGTAACGNDTLDRNTCSHHPWNITYEFTDNTALGSITFYPPIGIGKLYSSGQGATSNVTLNGTCCCPLFSVTAADVSGNSLTISANITEPGSTSPTCLPPEPNGLPPGAFTLGPRTTGSLSETATMDNSFRCT
ncbi:von Willebrand factor A domain-containing protein 7-like [Anneissia japonica]|uniref:von Willebrand factor A domain-containing protein 7-like n=1 Tax=Anneissia japonica TaxID=1529436 RepID=UPI0014257079|nr:von Willebrand factor A domain-containing protein 7-like [Anneissia japonica]